MSRSLLFFCAAIFFTAILKTPYLPVVRDKIVFADFLLLAALVTAKPRFNLPIRKRGTTQFGIIFISVCVISSLFGLFKVDKAWIYSHVIIETATYIYGVVNFWLATRLLDSWKKWNLAILAWLGGMAVASGVGLLALGTGWPGWAFEVGTHRLCTTLKNENQVPMLILPMMAVAISYAARRQTTKVQSLFLIVLTVACFLTAVGTGSRTALLMMILGAGGLGGILAKSLGMKRVLNLHLLTMSGMALTAGIVVYFIVAWSCFDGQYSLVRTPAWQRPAVRLIQWQTGEAALDETRPVQIAEALRVFPDHPLIGTGLKTSWLYTGAGGEIHNTYISLLVETGAIGLSFFLLMLGSAIFYASNGIPVCRHLWYRHLARCLLLGMLLIILYNGTMLGLRQRNIWILMGMLVAFGNLARSGGYAYQELRLPKYFRRLQPFL